jgi:hypothetical protein
MQTWVSRTCGSNPLTELLDKCEMGVYFIEWGFLSKGIHNVGEFYGIPVIFCKLLIQEMMDEYLVLIIGLS